MTRKHGHVMPISVLREGQMFIGKIGGIRLLKTGEASVMLTCSGEQLQAIAELRTGNITVYGNDEKPITDDRAVSLARIRSLAEQVAEAIDKELRQEVENGNI